ncbi:MAG: M43 family zinc metalloprotease [Kofleriaceae bacterium]
MFASPNELYASPAFRESGRRCGSPDQLLTRVNTVDPLGLRAPTDCTLSQTTINPDYNDPQVYVVQVVFHIIKRTDGTGDIPEALIHSQIEVLNEDFNALVGTRGGEGTNTKLQFVLAKRDPQGQPTTGIEVITNDTWFNDPGGAPNPMKEALAWDPTRYLNIYTNDAAGYLGYATFPEESAGTKDDGVVLVWSTVGRNAPQGGQYNLGRTATHEVGHYLGLLHTFQSGCGDTGAPYLTGDLVADTQPESEASYGCTAAASTCGGGMNPIDNYMDYSDDACMKRFTPEQANRLRCSLFNYRTVNTAPLASFSAVVEKQQVTFTNASTDLESAAQLSYLWTFGDGTTSSEPSPAHTFSAPGMYEVTLEVTDPGSGNATTTQTIRIDPPSGPGSGNGNGNGNGGGDGDGSGVTGGCDSGGGQHALLLGLALALVMRRRLKAAA